MRCKSSEKPKLKHKKGLWSPDEDQKLRDYIVNHGLGCWSSVPIHAGLQRNGKSCRLRWINYLRPGLKRGMFTLHEEKIILTLHGMLGNKWSQMSQHLPGRTDNEIKNHWHSYLKKKVENSENMKSQAICLDAQNKQTPSPSNYTRGDSSLESSGHLKGLSMAYSEADGCRNLPKILFADWLSLDEFHKFDTSGESLVSRDVCYHTSGSQRTVMNDTVHNDGSFSGDIQEGSSYGLANSVDHLQLKYEHQHVESDFYDLASEDDICRNFNSSDVMLYSCDDLYSASTPSQSDTRFLCNLWAARLNSV